MKHSLPAEGFYWAILSHSIPDVHNNGEWLFCFRRFKSSASISSRTTMTNQQPVTLAIAKDLNGRFSTRCSKAPASPAVVSGGATKNMILLQFAVALNRYVLGSNCVSCFVHGNETALLEVVDTKEE